jgi:acetyl-CoA carboxylase biotin carboxyl carrier protein
MSEPLDQREQADGAGDGAAPAAADGATSAAPAADAAAAAGAAAAADPAAIAPPAAGTPADPADVALLGLVDRLSTLLDRSELTELEVEIGGTGITLRKPSALAPTVAAPVPAPAQAPADPGAGTPAARSESAADVASAGRPAVRAPLTGIWYASPSPGSAPYVSVGSEVLAGQVIGLIEAMKLFNEIKSDLSGRVVRVVAEHGKLVKAKHPLIEVEPL